MSKPTEHKTVQACILTCTQEIRLTLVPRLSVVKELEAVVTTNLQPATRLRQAVLQRAFARGFLE